MGALAMYFLAGLGHCALLAAWGKTEDGCSDWQEALAVYGTALTAWPALDVVMLWMVNIK